MRLQTRRVIASVWCLVVLAVAAVAGQQLRELGLSDEETETRIHDSFIYGNLSLPGGGVLRALPAPRRPEVVRAAAQFAKSYLMSDRFRKRYAEDVANGNGGEAAPKPARTFAEFMKETQAEADKSLAEIRQASAGVPAEQLKAIEEPIRAGLQQMANTSPEDRRAWEESDRQRFADESERYKQALAEGRALPPNPDDLIKLRLRQFLMQTADVDFSAALRSQNGREVFVKPEYEGKPRIWKSCFRAGQAATDAARGFAAAWLKELGG